jgi:hypothetical protein
MSKPGVFVDETYRAARRVLLDALEALGTQRSAVILVGAQAIYLHTGESVTAIAPFTNDGDLVVDPVALVPVPRLEDAMRAQGFDLDASEVGRWRNKAGVIVDLLVPEALGGPGRRGARLGPHGKVAARKVRGLEAALVDCAPMGISSLSADDARVFSIRVAGPAALLIAKAHKIAERIDSPRLSDKDAYDALRILQVVSTSELAARMRMLTANAAARAVTAEGLQRLEELFLSKGAAGPKMLRRYVGVLEDPEVTVASFKDLLGDLLSSIRDQESSR